MPDVKHDRRSGPVGGGILLTVFIAYHVTTIIVSNLPSDGPAAGLQRVFARYALLTLYREATATRQDWGFFAPNPPRENEYMRVLVEDRSGRITDVRHDVYGRRTFPYLWYDRKGKVSRRLSRESEHEAGYAAWVCRAWERAHGGQPAVEVRFLRLVTHIPPPSAAGARDGYDPMALPVEQADAGRYRCADLPHGQLPPDLRRRFALPAAVEGSMKPAELDTWWDRRAARDPSRLPEFEPPHETRGLE